MRVRVNENVERNVYTAKKAGPRISWEDCIGESYSNVIREKNIMETGIGMRYTGLVVGREDGLILAFKNFFLNVFVCVRACERRRRTARVFLPDPSGTTTICVQYEKHNIIVVRLTKSLGRIVVVARRHRARLADVQERSATSVRTLSRRGAREFQ